MNLLFIEIEKIPLTLVCMPLITALIGWFTNFIAVKMLFHPRQPKQLLFWKIQGIFPKRQQAIAESLSKIVSQTLLSADDIKNQIHQSINTEKIIQEIDVYITRYFEETFLPKYPLIATFVSKKLQDEIKQGFITEIGKIAPKIMQNSMNDVAENIQIEEHIRSKINTLNPKNLETLLMKILQKEFRFIEIIGAVIGFIVGVFQIILLLFIE